MKGLILVLILVCLLLCGTLGNYIYINEVSDTLLRKVEALAPPDDAACASQLRELIDYWKGEVDTVCLSVSYTVADRISEHAETLAASVACGDRFGFYHSLSLLRDAIEDLRRMERPSLGTLF